MGRGETRPSRGSPKPINPRHETMMGFANKKTRMRRGFYWLYPSYGTTPMRHRTMHFAMSYLAKSCRRLTAVIGVAAIVGAAHAPTWAQEIPSRDLFQERGRGGQGNK